ncbi:hypothetical protein GINT2_001814 [Glugoides intestinalis]
MTGEETNMVLKGKPLLLIFLMLVSINATRYERIHAMLHQEIIPWCLIQKSIRDENNELCGNRIIVQKRIERVNKTLKAAKAYVRELEANKRKLAEECNLVKRDEAIVRVIDFFAEEERLAVNLRAVEAAIANFPREDVTALSKRIEVLEEEIQKKKVMLEDTRDELAKLDLLTSNFISASNLVVADGAPSILVAINDEKNLKEIKRVYDEIESEKSHLSELHAKAVKDLVAEEDYKRTLEKQVNDLEAFIKEMRGHTGDFFLKQEFSDKKNELIQKLKKIEEKFGMSIEEADFYRLERLKCISEKLSNDTLTQVKVISKVSDEPVSGTGESVRRADELVSGTGDPVRIEGDHLTSVNKAQSNTNEFTLMLSILAFPLFYLSYLVVSVIFL